MNTGETAFQSLCSQWLEQVRCRVAASTYMEYHRVTDVYITPALGRICLSEINSELLQQYIKDSLEKPSYSGRPLSSSSIKHILAVLKQILKFGMDRQELPPITLNGKIPETESRGGRCFRAADISRVENYAEKADIRAYSMLLCLYLGLRIGELCALRWEDIDLEQGTDKGGKAGPKIPGHDRRQPAGRRVGRGGDGGRGRDHRSDLGRGAVSYGRLSPFRLAVLPHRLQRDHGGGREAVFLHRGGYVG